MAIVDVEASRANGGDPADVLAAMLRGGATLLQLRAKSLAGAAFLEMAGLAVGLCAASGARLVVNDRADVARLSGAAGVHVGQEDLPAGAVRAIVGAAALVGVSAHSTAQVEAAAGQPIDYVAIGPVFPTSTKQSGYETVGLEGVGAAAGVARRLGLPLVAIGGITLERARAVLDAGADAVAVIGDLLPDPESRVRAYLERLAV